MEYLKMVVQVILISVVLGSIFTMLFYAFVWSADKSRKKSKQRFPHL